MLAIFSFVGFESATTLGAEARTPSAPSPVPSSSPPCLPVFFVVAVYGEVLGFRISSISLGDSANPFRFLCTQAGLPYLGPIISLGVLVSMFAATLACVIAASRVPAPDGPPRPGPPAPHPHPRPQRNPRSRQHPRRHPRLSPRAILSFQRTATSGYPRLDGHPARLRLPALPTESSPSRSSSISAEPTV